MGIYHTLGEVPRKRHIALRRDGELLHEHLVGNEGFAGPSSLLYHLRPPTLGSAPELLGEVDYARVPPGALKRRHFRTAALPSGGSPTLDRVPLLFNRDVAILHAAAGQTDEHFWRNGDADELAVMVDTYRPLHVAREATQAEDLDYPTSWEA